MENIRREDKRKILEIKNFRQRLVKGGEIDEFRILFAQIGNYKDATAREHAAATYPLFEKTMQLKLYTKLKNQFNHGDPLTQLIGVPKIFRTLEGEEKRIFVEEIAHGNAALQAAEFNDKIAAGVHDKGVNLRKIAKDATIKKQHAKQLKQILVSAGIQ